MLPSARVAKVKQQSSDAWLAAAINACTASLYAKLFDPAQPRDDHGRWTRGGWGGAANVQVAQNDASFGQIDLLQEEVFGGHTIERHVGKSDEYLKRRVFAFQNGDGRDPPFKAGTFSSLSSANKLVNSVLAQFPLSVAAVASGLMPDELLVTTFGSPTGRQAVAVSRLSSIFIDDTFSIKVFIIHDPFFPRGFRVHTAYPTSP